MNSNLKTLFTGQNLISKDVIDSTNTLAVWMLAESWLAEGTVIVAKEQTAGRGQQGTAWESEAGKNLLASFIFYPSFLSPKDIFFLNITFSLALYDFANSHLKKDVSVKWPNDLYYKDKKLAGLLIENSIRNNALNYSIVGIGLNVNQEKFSSDAANATSLKAQLNEDQPMEHVFNSLCTYIEGRYLQLKASKYEALKEEYLQVLYKYNALSRYNTNGKEIVGKIVDVMNDGRLILINEEGNPETYGFKEISFV